MFVTVGRNPDREAPFRTLAGCLIVVVIPWTTFVGTLVVWFGWNLALLLKWLFLLWMGLWMPAPPAVVAPDWQLAEINLEEMPSEPDLAEPPLPPLTPPRWADEEPLPIVEDSLALAPPEPRVIELVEDVHLLEVPFAVENEAVLKMLAVEDPILDKAMPDQIVAGLVGRPGRLARAPQVLHFPTEPTKRPGTCDMVLWVDVRGRATVREWADCPKRFRKHVQESLANARFRPGQDTSGERVAAPLNFVVTLRADSP